MIRIIVVDNCYSCPVNRTGSCHDLCEAWERAGGPDQEREAPIPADCPLDKLETDDTKWSWSKFESDIELPPGGCKVDTTYKSMVVLASEAIKKLAVKDTTIQYLRKKLVEERAKWIYTADDITTRRGIPQRYNNMDDARKDARKQIEKEIENDENTR